MRGRELELMRHATTTIASGLAAALTRQHDALARRWSAARAGHVKAVHRGRVASRRLREALAVIDAVALHGDAGRLGRAGRRLTRALGPVREIDVALVELDRAARRHAWPPELTSLFRRRLERERERRAKHMAAKLAKPDRARLRTDLRELSKRVTSVEDRSWQTALNARIVRRARSVLAASAAAGTIYVPERLHALRIAIKKLRYALELLPPTPGLDVAAALQLLKRAQRRFGSLHDVQILALHVQAIDPVPRRPADRAALASAVEALERDCREIHAQALALVPTVEECARLIRRELGARRRGRLAMAKAELDKKAEGLVLKAYGLER
jgi:CHAD domain-containing protein